MTSLQPTTPSGLDRLVRTCLAKDPDARWQSAADLARELEWIANAPPPSVGARPESRRKAVVTPALILAAGALIGLSVGYVLRVMPSSLPPAGTSRSLITVSPADQLRASQTDQVRAAGHLSRTAIALSPDGQSLVFSATQNNRQQLYVRPLAQLEATPLAETDGGASPFFSPDGQWVGFWANGALKKLAFNGGSVTTLCETQTIFGASWGDNDVLVQNWFDELRRRVPHD